MEKIAILMADLSGYTALTEIHGAEAAATIIEKYMDLVFKSLTGRSYMLERVGDQVVIISSQPEDIARTAVSLYQNAEAESHFLPVHAGIHFGEVLVQEGHFFGSTINLASRIAARAREGMILCTSDFIQALPQSESFHYIFHDNLRFKNILETKLIYELLPEYTITHEHKKTDPVCHIQLDKHERQFKVSHKNKTHFFCSAHCMGIFKEQVSASLCTAC